MHVGKRGPKKRIDLEAVWEMRKRVERDGESFRAAARDIAQYKPYSWETLRKWYSELEDEGTLPEQPPISDEVRDVVRRRFQEWRDGLRQARENRERLSERLRAAGIDPDLGSGELVEMARQLLSELSDIELLAKGSPSISGRLASQIHSNEEAALQEIQEARIRAEELEERRSLLQNYLEADNNFKALTKKLYPENG